MTKWFEEVANDASNIVSSRVRLSRNWEEYKFPSRLEPDEARTMIARLKQNFRDLGDRDGQFYEYEDLELMEKLDRTALRERRLLNRTLAEKTTPGGILCSEDERVSMVLNADDHIRLQVLASGLDLQECYAKADALDDYINEKIPYAFNEKYGYLTSYPTNVGTAMKASVVVHLPSLTMNKKFQELLGDMGRFGTTVRGVYGRGSVRGSQSEDTRHHRTRDSGAGSQRGGAALGAGKSVPRGFSVETPPGAGGRGVQVLRRSEICAPDDAQGSDDISISCLAGIADGLLKPAKFVSIYRLMIGIQPANLQKRSSKPLGREELEAERARYLREELPKLV